MIFGSVCSGIEAASVAWHPLGWRAAFLSEIEPFPRAVLAHHYPDVPLHGDFTTIREGQYAAIDVLVGGTPCQSFSVAGLRGGLSDERGNLALEYLRLAQRLRPSWVVWENVPGVLSSNGGRDFGAILGGMVECGYGVAYRVLDAQYVRVDGFGRAVPQRRRRVFVVGYLGDWRRAAAVLFERHGLSGHSPPRRQAGQGSAPTLSARTRGGGGLGTDFECDGGLNPLNAIDGASHSLAAARGGSKALDATMETYVGGFQDGNVSGSVVSKWSKGAGGPAGDECQHLVAHALRADGFDASEDGTGRGVPIVPVAQGVALRGRDEGATAELTGDVMTALRCGGGGGDKPHVLMQSSFAIQAGALRQNEASGPDGVGVQADHAYTLEARAEVQAIAFNARQDPDVFDGYTGPLDTDGSTQGIFSSWRVRRLMPVECERLQGFPDGYTSVPYRGKPAADGPRYKALGNSMAVNVMRWIGWRMQQLENMRGHNGGPTFEEAE